MTYDERRNYLRAQLEIELDNDDDAFGEIALEMDSWDGSLNDSRCYYMEELDEILGDKKPSTVINMLDSDFDSNDSYFYFDNLGNLSSTDDPISIYRDEIGTNDMMDWLEDYGLRGAVVRNDTIEEIVEMLSDVNYDEDDMTDNEFKEECESIGLDVSELTIDDEDEVEEPDDIDSDMGYDPYMGMVTDEV